MTHSRRRWSSLSLVTVPCAKTLLCRYVVRYSYHRVKEANSRGEGGGGGVGKPLVLHKSGGGGAQYKNLKIVGPHTPFPLPIHNA